MAQICLSVTFQLPFSDISSVFTVEIKTVSRTTHILQYVNKLYAWEKSSLKKNKQTFHFFNNYCMKKWKIKQHLMLHNYVQLLAFQLIFFYFFILWIIEILYIFLQQKCKRWFWICTKVQITIKKEINGEWFQKQKFFRVFLFIPCFL